MRHLFICTDCGEYFEKKDASTLCPECLSKPVLKPEKPKQVKASLKRVTPVKESKPKNKGAKK